MMNNGSRWGVKGSNEISEGLSGIYRYEENLDLSSATLKAGNRLSSVGLSGGFGTVTLGQIYSASYNHVGAMTDNGVWVGNNNSPTVRTPSNLSYSASTGPISFQLDAGMGAGTGRSLDRAELGLSFDTGAATIGMAFTTEEDIDGKTKTRTGKTRTSAFGVSVPVGGLTLAGSWMEIKTTRFATDRSPGKLGSPALCRMERWENAKIEDDEVVALDSDDPEKPFQRVKERNGFKTTDDVLKFDKGTGEYTCKLDTNQTPRNIPDTNNPMYADVIIVPKFQDAVASKLEVPAMPEKTVKDKQMRFSVTGPLGDTGMSFAVNVHNNPDKKGVGENPWNAHVSKSLGGGARLAFEYIDNDDNVNTETGKKIANEALVHLQVDF